MQRAFTFFIAELAAGFSAYFMARTFWKLGIHQKHLELLHLDRCDADLTVSCIIFLSSKQFLAQRFSCFYTKSK